MKIFRILRAFIHLGSLTLFAPFFCLYHFYVVRKHRKEYKRKIKESYDKFNGLDEVDMDFENARLAQVDNNFSRFSPRGGDIHNVSYRV